MPVRALLAGIAAALAASAAVLPAAGPARARPGAPAADALPTVAEWTGYRAASTYPDVVDLAGRIAEASPTAHLGTLGLSGEERTIPMLLLADPPVAEPEDVGERLVALLLGGIHGGEACGRDALLALARELALTPRHPLLERLVVAIVPDYNPDGGIRQALDNRPGQVGPEAGAGERRNAEGLDLNRDHVKLQAPESRALARFLRRFEPAVVVDTHVTDGSFHRYHLTHSGPKHPATDPRVIDAVRDRALPAIERCLAVQGWSTGTYGNFDEDETSWSTYSALPRFGTNLRGLRGHLSFLSEASAHVPFETRVRVTLDFCREVLRWTSREADGVAELRAALAEGPGPDGVQVPLGAELRAAPLPVVVPAFELVERDGHVLPTERHREVEVALRDRYDGSRPVALPDAYLLARPAPSAGDGSKGAAGTWPPRAVEALTRHGVRVEEVREDVDLDVEVLTAAGVERAEAPFEGHRLVRVEVEARRERRRVTAGSLLIPADQPLHRLAGYLLEPGAEDGLTAWGLLGAESGSELPVARVRDEMPVLARPLAPLPEDRPPDRRLTFAALHEGDDRPRFDGPPVAGLRWSEASGLLLEKDGRLQRADPLTGRCAPLVDVDAVSAAIAALPGVEPEEAEKVARRTPTTLDDAETAFVFEHEGDLYLAAVDGSAARRLTESDGTEELPTFSPDGRHVAFVRAHDLWVVDVETGEERALTEGGGPDLRRGKADWVTYEEIFGRSWRTYWWSPDSRRIAFLETDSSELPEFTVVKDSEEPQVVERVRYPKPGDPNPAVRIGIADVSGGPVRWADLTAYDHGGYLVKRLTWWPDGRDLLVLVQDRRQTWLDACTLSPRGGRPRRLFRETTEAWVDVPPDPVFLEDGSFLVVLGRSGYRHPYHYSRRGRLRGQLTSGAWDVRTVHHVDEEARVVYYSGTRGSPVELHLERVSLDGGPPERITRASGWHAVSFSEDGRWFLDRHSSLERPETIVLRWPQGDAVRVIDSNPVRALELFDVQPVRRVTIPARDGWELQATVRHPPGFGPDGEAAPAWFLTYGGPGAPTVQDRWRRVSGDALLAASGLVVFRCDPRSASGQGAVSAWTAYRQLGVQELRDIEDAIAWLKGQPGVDPGRVGMSGHSYGGFMTAHAMTHSKLFAAGIAGAPVTDWRDYDSIYTERYMGTPQDNPEGYERTSVVEAAEHLSGRLLLLHGAIDDNVHAQNTMKLVAALQRADVPFELMVYPGARHGIRGLAYRRLVYEFTLRTMGLETTGLGTTGLGTTELGTTGLETTELGTTGLGTTGLGTTGLETTELGTTELGTTGLETTGPRGAALGTTGPRGAGNGSDEGADPGAPD